MTIAQTVNATNQITKFKYVTALKAKNKHNTLQRRATIKAVTLIATTKNFMQIRPLGNNIKLAKMH